jgi:phosphatidylglycerophosphate synthase
MSPAAKAASRLPLLSVANVISLFRAALAPAILLLLVHNTPKSLVWALAVAIVAGGSDLADGYIARRRGVSDLGRYVDGACDAIFNIAVFLGFLAIGWIGVWAFTAIFFAEVIVPYLGIFTKQIGQPFGIRWTARLKVVLHSLAQIAVIAAALIDAPQLARFGIGAAIAASVVYVVDHGAYTLRRMSRSGGA